MHARMRIQERQWCSSESGMHKVSLLLGYLSNFNLTWATDAKKKKHAQCAECMHLIYCNTCAHSRMHPWHTHTSHTCILMDAFRGTYMNACTYAYTHIYTCVHVYKLTVDAAQSAGTIDCREHTQREDCVSLFMCIYDFIHVLAHTCLHSSCIWLRAITCSVRAWIACLCLRVRFM